MVSHLVFTIVSLTQPCKSMHNSDLLQTSTEYADLSTNALKRREVKFLAEFYSNLLQETEAPQCC